MKIINDSLEGRSECVHLLYKIQQLCWQHWNRHAAVVSVPGYRMSMYTSGNSCVTDKAAESLLHS